MYCVIQKVENKKENIYGTRKNIIVSESSWSINDIPQKTTYHYNYSDERFERHIKAAYKISIHKSYRENGKVKKKQWAICTMGYYDVLESGPFDFIRSSEIEDLVVDMDITESEFWDMIYKKVDPLRESIQNEFEQTEEYKAKQYQDKITTLYLGHKAMFEEKHGKDTYDYCYDVFGVLRNKEYLKELEQNYKSQKEYESNSQKEYESNTNSNYNSYSGYQGIKQSNYNDKEKESLKKIYKTLAMKFHPDVCKDDDGETMKIINQLKNEWGL